MVFFLISTLLKAWHDPKLQLSEKSKNIDTSEFTFDIIRDLAKCNLRSMSLDEGIDKYNSVLKNTLDKHVPEKTKTVKTRSPIPWFSDDIRSQIQNRRLENEKRTQCTQWPSLPFTNKEE